MKRSDLKTGYLFQQRNGDKAIVLLGTDNGDIYSCVQQSGIASTWGQLNFYEEDLTYKDSKDADIVKVWGLPDTGNSYLLTMEVRNRKLLLERK